MPEVSWNAAAWGIMVALALPLAAQEDDEHHMAADRLRQLARLSVQQAPLAADAVRVAAVLLEHAAKFSSEDPELWRLRMDAAGQLAPEAGGAAVRDLLAEYLRIASRDDVAQLRFVELLITDAQTAPQRAAAYERLVDGPRSGSLSQPLRARLAWQSAQLHRGRGDDQAYRRMLKRSLELDATHAPAAAGAYEVLSGSPGVSEADRFRALLMWHAAAPTDPRTHLHIARSLLRCGHYQMAGAWFEAADFLAAEQGGLEAGDVWQLAADWALSLWAAGDPRAGLELIRSVRMTAAEDLQDSSAVPRMLQGLSAALAAAEAGAAEALEALVQSAGAQGLPGAEALAAALAMADSQRRVMELRHVDERHRGQPVGVVAAVELRKLGAEPPMDGACLAVGRMAQQIPADLRRIGATSSPYVTLRITAVRNNLLFAQPLRVTLTLTNLSAIPLAMEPGGAAPGMVFLTPIIKVADGPWQRLAPQMVDMRRSLVLGSGRSVAVYTQLDGGDLVRLLDDNPEQAVQISVRAVLNPRPAAGGDFVPGLLGTEVVTPRMERVAQPPSNVRIQQMLEWLETGGTQGMLAAAWLARMAGILSADHEADAQRIATALTQTWERSDPAWQAWIVSYLSAGEATRRRVPTLISRALRSEHMAVRYALVVALADRPDAPELTALLRLPRADQSRSFAVNWRNLLLAARQSAGDAAGR